MCLSANKQSSRIGSSTDRANSNLPRQRRDDNLSVIPIFSIADMAYPSTVRKFLCTLPTRGGVGKELPNYDGVIPSPRTTRLDRFAMRGPRGLEWPCLPRPLTREFIGPVVWISHGDGCHWRDASAIQTGACSLLFQEIAGRTCGFPHVRPQIGRRAAGSGTGNEQAPG